MIGTIIAGDAVCVVGWDAGSNRPEVARATRANLATSKTVLGVVESVNGGAGTASVLVAGEVAKESVTSLGAGGSRIIATDIMQDDATPHLQCRLVRVDRPDGSEHVVGTCDENGHLALQPRASQETSPLQLFNPRSYGARFDGVTDDLPALQAMHDALPEHGGIVHFPTGTAWLSDTWRVSKSFEWRSDGGGTKNVDTRFKVAPGRTAIILDNSETSEDENSAQYHHMTRISVDSQILVHATAGGSSLGRGIYAEFVANGVVRKGDCFIDANRSSAVFFRAGSSGTFGATIPGWSDTLGSTVVSNGITYTTEAFPVVHETDHDYDEGDRVYAPSDNRFYFECEGAGRSAMERPSFLAGGDLAGGLAIDDTYVDGEVTWRARCAAGVMVLSDLGLIERVYAIGFTGPALMMAGGEGMYGSNATVTNTNCFHIQHVFAEYCGVGVACMGSNCNGWIIGRLVAQNIGTLQPTPNDVIAADYAGLGGHCIHDVSLASGLVNALYVELPSGRPILKNGLGRLTVVSCFAEANDKPHFVNGTTTILGGSLEPTAESNNVIHLDPSGNHGRGLVETWSQAGETRTASLLTRGASVAASVLYRFSAPTAADGVNFYGFIKGYQTPSAWWGFQHSGQAFNNTYHLSTSEATTEGPGWQCYPRGFFLGDPDLASPRFVGSEHAVEEVTLRGGLRLVGDEFRNAAPAADAWLRRVITSEGYRGRAWEGNHHYRAAVSDWGIFGDVVEPRANGAWPAGGAQVWVCTGADGAGMSDTDEPAWPLAPVPGVTTVLDNDVEWTFLGSTPGWTTVESLTPDGV